LQSPPTTPTPSPPLSPPPTSPPPPSSLGSWNSTSLAASLPNSSDDFAAYPCSRPRMLTPSPRLVTERPHEAVETRRCMVARVPCLASHNGRI
jgi:hypothetical protein